MGTAATCFVGADVSKATLDACLLRPNGPARTAAFPNNASGHTALIAWADRSADGAGLHFCLEATGPYSDPPATALANAGRRVSVANPTRVKAHAAAGGPGNKTDPADARAIARRPGSRRRRRSASSRAWCAAATTGARWRPARKPGSTRPR